MSTDVDTDMDPGDWPSSNLEQEPKTATTGAAAADDENKAKDSETDPITASYPVFLNPALPLGRRLLVLQQPNRADESSSSRRSAPLELRLKAASGMVEVDVPLDYGGEAYDRDKGLRWGRVLQASMAAKNGGSHGLAGGFGFGAVQQQQQQQRGGPRRRNEVDAEDLLDWTEAVRQDKVLRRQTLGGQYPDADEVQYMVGVFQGKDLHLTPVSSLVHLRPQLHHIDAATQQERQAAAKESSGAAAGGGGGGGGGGSGSGGAGPSSGGPAARAIHMTIKTTTDGESLATETIADRLRSVQGEAWRRMRYTDENDEAAWDVYNESLFLDAPAPRDGGDGGGAGPDKNSRDDDENDDDSDGGGDKQEAQLGGSIEGVVSRFAAMWSADRLLEAVSGVKKPEPAAVAETTTRTGGGPGSSDDAVAAAAGGAKQKTAEAARAGTTMTATETETAARRPKRAPRGGSTVATRRTSGRGG